MERAKRSVLKRLLLPLIILLLAVGILALLVATRPETHAVEVREKAWPVATAEVKLGSWPRTLMLYGKVDALTRTTLNAALSADVQKVSVIEGDQVHGGQLLLVLDDRDYRLDLAQREAEVEQAEAAIQSELSAHRGNLEALPREKRLLSLVQAEVSRLQDLIEKKLTSQSNLDTSRQALARQAIAVSRIEEKVRAHESKMRELEARLAQKRAALEKAQLQLERTRIEAPYAGRVTRVRVSVGQRVNPGNPMLDLFEEDSLVFRALIPERYLQDVQEARRKGVSLRVTGQLEGQVLEGELVSLGASIPDGVGGVEGLFRVIRGQAFLQLGRVTTLHLHLPALDGVVPIPFEALYGSDKVYLVDEENRLRPVTVERVGELRREGKDLLLIRSSALRNGQRLLLTQLPNAVEGLLVKVVPDE